MLLAIAAIAVVAGCLENNIPYPHIQANFTAFKVSDAARDAVIDTVTRTVTVYLSDAADIENVIVEEYALSPAEVEWSDSSQYLSGIDMSRQLQTTLSLYQDYSWTIKAVQDIERYFTVEQQVGASTIDVPGRRVVAYVSASASLSSLLVTSIKLAGSTAVMSPDISGQRIDFSSPVSVSIDEHGRTVEWALYVIPTDESVSTERVDAWSCVAWLYGSGEEGKDCGFEYRRSDSDTWTRLASSQVTVDGGTFTGRLTGLDPLTSYVARAYSGEDYGSEVDFTTEGVEQMPNSSFDEWWLDGKVWNPWAETDESYWDTGNKGATTLGSSNTYPSDDTPTGSGQSACLETKFVGIGVVGKLASGNIFAGRYVKTDGTNGILEFGRPWTLRPTGLRGWFKYHSASISDAPKGSEFESLKGTPDTGIVWVALIDSDDPFEIRTNPSNRQLFDPDGDEVVAYGKIEWDSDVTEWTQFEFELQYNSTSRVPKYLLCTASASSLGDYFVGGDGSVLMLDDLELLYDY